MRDSRALYPEARLDRNPPALGRENELRRIAGPSVVLPVSKVEAAHRFSVEIETRLDYETV